MFNKIVELVSLFIWVRDAALIARRLRPEDAKRYVLAA
jgi:hypothetical protein